MKCWLWLGVAGLSLVACQEPTQITIEVTTDVDCSALITGIAVGSYGEVEGKPPTSTRAACDSAGRVGSLVAVPAGEGSSEIAFHIISHVGGDINQCEDPQPGDDCIVSRRVLGYLEHKKLLVPVAQRESCRGKPCDATTTCVRGACVPAQIDPNKCADADGCGEDELGGAGGVGGAGGAGGAGGGPTDPDALVYDWSKTFGDPAAPDGGYAVGIDDQGAIHVGAIIADGGDDLGQGSVSDLVVVAYDAAGNGVVSQYSNNSGDTTLGGLAVGGAGDAHFVAGAMGMGDYGNGMMIGGQSGRDIVVGGIKPDGALDWLRAYGTANTLQAVHDGWDVAVDAAGAVYAVGRVSGTNVIIEGDDVPANSLFVVSYDSAGNKRWLQHFDGSANTASLATDDAGHLYVAGTHLTLALPNLPTATLTDGFVAQLDASTGAPMWAKGLGGTGADSADGVAVGRGGRVFVTGTVTSAVDFGGGPITFAGGGNDTYVVALDPSGNHVWSRSIGVVDADLAGGIATSRAGSLFVLSNASGTPNSRVVSLTADGGDRFTLLFGGESTAAFLQDAAVGPQGELAVVGLYRDAVAIEGHTLPTAASQDGFVLRFAAP